MAKTAQLEEFDEALYKVCTAFEDEKAKLIFVFRSREMERITKSILSQLLNNQSLLSIPMNGLIHQKSNFHSNMLVIQLVSERKLDLVVEMC